MIKCNKGFYVQEKRYLFQKNLKQLFDWEGGEL